MSHSLGRRAQFCVVAVLLVSLLSLAGCAGNQVQTETHEHEATGQREMQIPHLEPVDLGEGQKLHVVASTGIIGDVVSQVGGEAITLTTLLEVGQDPHSYEPAAADVARIESSDVMFVNGLDLEETLLTVVEPLEGQVAVIPVSAGVELRQVAGGDPHVWMDPHNVEIWAANIAAVLSDLDPANADFYEANAAAYREQLERLDAYLVEQVGRIPPAERKLVTNHDSLGYFADRYGFQIVGTVFAGASQVAEPSAGELAELVEVIEAEGVRAIFVETTMSGELASLVSREVGREVGVYTLYTGSLGEPGSGADTYLGMMRANVDTIVAGLQ